MKSRNRKANKGKLSFVDIPEEAKKGLSILALRCMCDLLATHPHFNFRTEIISCVVPFIIYRDEKVMLFTYYRQEIYVIWRSYKIRQKQSNVFFQSRRWKVEIDVPNWSGPNILSQPFLPFQLADIVVSCVKRIFKEDKSGEVTLEVKFHRFLSWFD